MNRHDAAAGIRSDAPRVLGRGGVGVVEEVEDRRSGKRVARKRLKRDVAHDRRQREVLRREARVLRSLSHRGIPRVDAWSSGDDAEPWFTMTLVDGEDLAETLERASFPFAGGVDVVERAAAVVESAHRRGVVHGDLKPANVRVDRDGDVFVLDWGLAREVGEAARGGGSASGTVAYMAPEQASGDAIDRRTDVFNLGATLCHVLTGAPPHDPSDPEAPVTAALGRCDRALERLDRSGADRRLVRLVRRCLARDPRRRPADAGAVRRALARIRRRRQLGAWWARVTRFVR
ncbi:MAG: serine/threonine-protein kinase [Planctomycetota bacterium JB042]